MQQIYHSNAKTNLNIRYQLQSNSGSNSELASRFQNKAFTHFFILDLVFVIASKFKM